MSEKKVTVKQDGARMEITYECAPLPTVQRVGYAKPFITIFMTDGTEVMVRVEEGDTKKTIADRVRLALEGKYGA